ncbi:hypothetical protein BO221_10495 [Archangium sp. Cb G35]|nr:hypothetical protein BO221_10495 [Archangium sp. Cb G35]
MQESETARAAPIDVESVEALLQTKAGDMYRELSPADASTLKLTVRPERASPVFPICMGTCRLCILPRS